VRLFAGVPLGPELGARLAERVGPTLGADFRPVRSAGLHATLVFLGDVPEAAVERLGEGMLAALGRPAAPRLGLAGAGAFPDLERARVLWIGVEDPEGFLAASRAAVLAGLSAAARAAGLDPGRWAGEPFHPHVTVARPRRRPAPAPVAFRELEAGLAWRPAAVELLESRPTGPGRSYVPRARLPLAP